jgi:predicted nucleic acid-binding protein
MPVTYLDSSAIVKLVVAEPESPALRGHLRRRRPLVSSALARTEVLRALLPAGAAATTAGRAVLAGLDLLRVNHRLLSDAAALEPVELRTLDAIHLATARRFGTELRLVVTYDDRMRVAADELGIRTAAPA